MEKAKYPGVDYSDHGVMGNNANTRPQDDMQAIRETLDKCNSIIEDIGQKLGAENEEQNMAQKIGPLNNELKENMTKLTNLLQ